jgi:3-oxoacyl-(acyl-carrier-protein) synthase
MGQEVNDITETAAIKKIFGNQANKLAVSSTKSMQGHASGATCTWEAVALSLALKNQIVPTPANYQVPFQENDPDVVPYNSRPGNLQYSLSNSFVVGGMSAALVFSSCEKE